MNGHSDEKICLYSIDKTFAALDIFLDLWYDLRVKQGCFATIPTDLTHGCAELNDDDGDVCGSGSANVLSPSAFFGSRACACEDYVVPAVCFASPFRPSARIPRRVHLRRDRESESLTAEKAEARWAYGNGRDGFCVKVC